MTPPTTPDAREAVAPLSDYDLARIKGYGTRYGLKLTRSEADGLFARLDDADAALAAARPFIAAEWQPIETAPRGRASYLVWCPDRENIYVVTWNAYRECWQHFCNTHAFLTEQPTHWQPLAAPPTAIQETVK